MMNSAVRFLVISALLAPVATPARAATDIGDAPPPLVVSEWLKGGPVNWNRDLGKRVYMVEFWVTWCAPCKISIPRLTEFQT